LKECIKTKLLKTKYFILFIICWLTIIIVKAVPSPILHLPFSNSLKDVISANFISGTNIGFTTDRFGTPNEAVQLNQNSEMFLPAAMIAASGLDTCTNFSMIFWIKAYNQNRSYLFSGGNNINSMYLEINDGSGALWSYWNSGGYPGIQTDNPGYLQDSTWHQIVFSKFNDSIMIYLDGVLSKKQYFPGSLHPKIPATVNIMLGKLIANSNLFSFTGAMDDVSFYNLGLTSTQVDSIFNKNEFVYLNQNLLYYDDTLSVKLNGIKAQNSYSLLLMNNSNFIVDTLFFNNANAMSTFSFVIDASITPGIYFLSLSDSNFNTICQSSKFVINGLAPIHLLQPPLDSIQTWLTYSQHNLKWTYHKPSAFNIYLQIDSGVWQTLASNYYSNNFEYNFKLPFYYSGSKLKFKVSVSNNTNNSVLGEVNILFKDEQYYKLTELNSACNFPNMDGVGGTYFNGKYRLLGGWNPFIYTNSTTNAMYSSIDGKSWNFDGNAPWAGRHTFGTLEFNNKLWVLGGDCNSGYLIKDIWNSVDGQNWQLINSNPPWGDRILSNFAVFNNKMYVFGGVSLGICGNYSSTSTNCYNDVWSSTDGITWQLETSNAAWNCRGITGGSVILNNKLWLLGGGEYQKSYYKDVWRSDDGITWKQAIGYAPWVGRQYGDVATFDNKMWLVAGVNPYHGGNLNDVWHSPDGLNWFAIPTSLFPARHATTLISRPDSLVIIAGNLWNDAWSITKDTQCKFSLNITSDTIKLNYGDTLKWTNLNFSNWIDNDESIVLDSFPKTGNVVVNALPVGFHAISVTGKDNKYCIQQKVVTIKIEKRKVIIAANDTTSIYGDSKFTNSYSILNIPNSIHSANFLTTAPILNCTITDSSAIGNYPIFINNAVLADTNNFNVSYLTGNHLVLPRVLNLQYNDTSIEYGNLYGAPLYKLLNVPTWHDTNILTNVPTDSVINYSGKVGNFEIWPSNFQINDSNFVINPEKAILTITPATLHITPLNTIHIYGDSLQFSNNFVYTGFKNNENANNALTQLPQNLSNVSYPASVGTYTFTASQAISNFNNYKIIYDTALLTISPRLLNFTPIDTISIYGDTPVLTNQFIITNLMPFDSLNNIINQYPIQSTTANSTSNIGYYNIVASAGLLSTNNYIINTLVGNLNILKRTLKIVPNNDTIYYGHAPSLTYTVIGNANFDSINSIVSNIVIATNAMPPVQVSQYPIYINSFNQLNGNYEIISSDTATLEVLPVTLIITVQDTFSKFGEPYNPPVLTFTGFQFNDNEFNAFAQGPLVSAILLINQFTNVGQYLNTASNAILNNNNYTIQYQSGNYFVEPQLLTIQPEVLSLIYGDYIPVPNFIYSGIQNNVIPDSLFTIMPQFFSLANSNSAIGSYPSWLNNGLLNNNNYILKFDSSLVNISNRLLILSINDTASVYGDSIVLPSVHVSGFINNDSISNVFLNPPIGIVVANSKSNIGQYVIAIVDTQMANNNYTLQLTQGVCTINSAPLYIVAKDTIIQYGTNIGNCLHYNVNGYKLNQNADSVFAIFPLANSIISNNPTVGTFPISIQNVLLSNQNYNPILSNGLLTITPAILTIKAIADSSIYGDSVSQIKSIMYSGIKYDDNLDSIFTTYPIATTLATKDSSVDQYPITISGLNNWSNNYNFNIVNNLHTINTATLILSVADTTNTYGNMPVMPNILAQGLKNNENIIQNFSLMPTVTSSCNNFSSAGSYPIILNPGNLNNSNYNVIYNNASLTNHQAPLWVNVSDTISIYGNAVILPPIKYVGFKNNEQAINNYGTLPYLQCNASATSNIGVHNINLIPGILSNNNYTVHYDSAFLNIKKRNLILSCNDTSFVYGDSVKLPKVKYTGFVNMDNENNTLSTLPVVNYDNNKNAGMYNLHITDTITALNYYIIAYTNARLTISKAILDISIADSFGVFGDAPIVTSFKVNGFKYNDNINVISPSIIINVNANNYSDVGTYPIVVSNLNNLSALNYTFKTDTALYSVIKRNAQLIAIDTFRDYGKPNLAFTFYAKGLVNNNSILDIDIMPNLSSIANEFSNKGKYTITISNAQDKNYLFSYNHAWLTIKPTLPIIDITTTRLNENNTLTNVKIISTGGEVLNTGLCYDAESLPDTTQYLVTSNIDSIKNNFSNSFSIFKNYPNNQSIKFRAFALNSAGIAYSNETQLKASSDNNAIIFPNPTNSIVNVSVNNNLIDGTLIITNALAKKMFEQQIIKTNFTIDLAHFAKGIYYLKIIAKDSSVLIKKIIKL
jgi:hypothetical protein